MALPASELARADLAVVVPAFELKGGESGSWKTSASKYDWKRNMRIEPQEGYPIIEQN